MVPHTSHFQRKPRLSNVSHLQFWCAMYLPSKINNSNNKYAFDLTIQKCFHNNITIILKCLCFSSLQKQQQHTTYQHILNSSDNSNSSSASSVTSGSTSSAPNGQYILVQRAGLIAGNSHSAPRASSAPPAQNQV